MPASELGFNLLANRLPDAGLVFFRNSVQRIFLDLLRSYQTYWTGQDDMFRKEEIRSDGGRVDLVWMEQGLLLLFAFEDSTHKQECLSPACSRGLLFPKPTK